MLILRLTRKIIFIKKFEIPAYYRSSITGRIKEFRRQQDTRKSDFSPAIVDFGALEIVLARHFGFCYGVENAIEISYRAIEENPGKRIFLLSQMIHNQEVNADLQSRGIEFILDTEGNQLIPYSELKVEDIIIIPAFGTTLEIEHMLLDAGLEVQKYNTTCPFVERVWKRSEKLGRESYTVIIHGKPRHEETRATFSHSASNAPALIVENLDDCKRLVPYLKHEKSSAEFYTEFAGKFSPDFDPTLHFNRVGVVNQTTMLASETQAIADFIKSVMVEVYGEANLKEHVADTRDTLCYATNDNQDSTYELLKTGADLAIVVGGYNSSNTSHLVELCEGSFPTFFINSEKELQSADIIRHFDIHQRNMVETFGYLPAKQKPRIVLTSGASCPDTLVDRVMLKLLDFFPGSIPLTEVLKAY